MAVFRLFSIGEKPMKASVQHMFLLFRLNYTTTANLLVHHWEHLIERICHLNSVALSFLNFTVFSLTSPSCEAVGLNIKSAYLNTNQYYCLNSTWKLDGQGQVWSILFRQTTPKARMLGTFNIVLFGFLKPFGRNMIDLHCEMRFLWTTPMLFLV